MQRIILSLVIGTAVTFFTTTPTVHGAPPPVPWQITINGHDRGVMFLTFLTGTPPTNPATGYGISLDALGPFTLTGTWDLDANDDITCGFVQQIDGGSFSGNFVAKIRGNGGLFAHATTTHGPQKFKAPAPGPVVDLSGSWVGEVKSDHKKALTAFLLTPSTNNMPGWFDLNGTGIGDSGSFDLAGALLVTTDHNAAGYTVSMYSLTTSQAAFVGRLTRKGNKLRLSGRDENGKSVVFHAEKPNL